jgi:hypothetical protein
LSGLLKQCEWRRRRRRRRRRRMMRRRGGARPVFKHNKGLDDGRDAVSA